MSDMVCMCACIYVYICVCVCVCVCVVVAQLQFCLSLISVTELKHPYPRQFSKERVSSAGNTNPQANLI